MKHQLTITGNNYNINHSVPFEGVACDQNDINKVFDFAYNMTFGTRGEHRKYRSGGSIKRRNGELFANTFQGKLAEFFFYAYCKKNGLNLPIPDTKEYGLGSWDEADFIINNKTISIKSMSFFSNLLLLEEKDWNKTGSYIPNDCIYDFHVIVRVSPDIKKILRDQRFFYSDDVDKDKLYSCIQSKNFKCDMPGFINNEDLKAIIQNEFLLPKNGMLNGRIPMDASNYYCQAGDFRKIDELLNILK